MKIEIVRKKFTTNLLKKFKKAGMNYSQMADAIGCSREQIENRLMELEAKREKGRGGQFLSDIEHLIGISPENIKRARGAW